MSADFEFPIGFALLFLLWTLCAALLVRAANLSDICRSGTDNDSLLIFFYGKNNRILQPALA